MKKLFLFPSPTFLSPSPIGAPSPEPLSASTPLRLHCSLSCNNKLLILEATVCKHDIYSKIRMETKTMKVGSIILRSEKRVH